MPRQPRVTVSHPMGHACPMPAFSLSPIGSSTPTVSGSATWVKGAEPKADSWRARADQFSILLTAEGSTTPAMDYWQGVGHRYAISEFQHLARPVRRLTPTPRGGYNAYEWEHSRPAVPTVGAVLGCVLGDARTYLDHRDSESPVDGLISAGLLDPAAPDFSVWDALDTWESLRVQFRRWQVIEDATGVTLDAAWDVLDAEGLI